MKKPKYVITRRRSRDGEISFYWDAEERGKKAGMHRERLSDVPEEAFERAERLNKQLESTLFEMKMESEQARIVTVDVLIGMYEKDLDMFRSLQPKTQYGYEANLKVVSRYLGKTRIDAFTPQLCHRWYEKLREDFSLKRANVIYNQAKMLFRLSIRENLLPSNPFKEVKMKTPRRKNRELMERVYWDRNYYERFIGACRENGHEVMAVAAMIAFELCQRQCDIIGSWQIDDENEKYWHAITWNDYDGEHLRIIQSKTDAPVYAHIAEQVPELKVALDRLERHNTQIINYVPTRRKGQRGRVHIRPYNGHLFRKEYRRMREAAGLPEALKFTNFRHGGLMELGLSGVGDDLKQALSGHKQRSTLDKYVMPTSEMADRALAARRVNKRT